MSFNYAINRLLDLQDTNFMVYDMDVKDDYITYTVKHKPEAFYVCKRCGHKNDSYHDKEWITLYDLPLGPKRVKWRIERMRILCHCSLNYRVELLSFKSTHHHLTKRFVDYVEYTLCSKMLTVADVARIFNLDYGVVYKIDHQVLLRMWQELELPDPINIAVDEKAYKRGHNYVTLVSDVDRKMVIWVSNGKDKAALDIFFKIMGPERCAKIKTVSKDLHKPYAASCLEYIPQAREVADPFHVVKKMNDVLDQCRREVIESNDTTKPTKKNLKSLNWVMRFKKDNLDDYGSRKLEKLEKLNEPLYKAYLCKEYFFEFFKFSPHQIELAKTFLEDWLSEAVTVPLEAFREFINFVINHKQRILNIILTQRSSAFSEAINRKVNVIIAMGHGYRCLEYLKLKILQRCGPIGRFWKKADQKNSPIIA